jgi:hypothetical protein
MAAGVVVKSKIYIGDSRMRFTGKCKIGYNGQFLTNCDDLRIDRCPRGWNVVGFAHNPGGQDYKKSSFMQNGDHYGAKEGESIGCIIIDTPQFRGIKDYSCLDDLRKDLSEGVPLKSKNRQPAEHFGQHFPIRFLVGSTFAELPPECFLYDVEMLGFSW